MNEKELEDILGKDTLKALDERYIRGGVDIGTEECETNPIIAKKQKVADFYKSLDDDGKLLLGMICDTSTYDIERTIRTLSDKNNICKDYKDLVVDKCKGIISKMSQSDGIPTMTGSMTLFKF